MSQNPTTCGWSPPLGLASLTPLRQIRFVAPSLELSWVSPRVRAVHSHQSERSQSLRPRSVGKLQSVKSLKTLAKVRSICCKVFKKNGRSLAKHGSLARILELLSGKISRNQSHLAQPPAEKTVIIQLELD